MKKVFDNLNLIENERVCHPMDHYIKGSIYRGEEAYVPSFSISYEYILVGEIRVRFVANQAQFSHAVDNAKKQFNRTLFNDLIGMIYEIKSNVYAGDTNNALKMCDKALEYMT